MTIPRWRAMMDYWKRYPPIHIIAAGMAGIKTDEPRSLAPAPPELPEFED